MGIINQRKELRKEIKKSSTIFLMAHKDMDLDALGSCIGLYTILTKKNKECYIIIDDKQHEMGVEKVLLELDGYLKIIKSENIEEKLNKRIKKNLLIILDTNKTDLVQSKDALKKFDRKLIIDHHDISKSTIKDAVKIIDNKVSSTCEMITELIEYYDVEVEPYYATVLLSGIVLDTNNFTLKTTSDTYYSAYYLTCLGASAKKVQYLLKQDLDEYADKSF